MTYFKNITTLEELRKAYKKLVKENHPDNGGSEETIKAINVEYEKVFKILSETDSTAKDFNQNMKYNKEEDQELREVLNNIINLNVTIEIIGSWIWVSGNTYRVKDELKANGFKWGAKKKMWFWHSADEVVKSKGFIDINKIRFKYGSQLVKEENNMKALTA